MTKRVFYGCASLLMLAATYHLGSTNARAASGMTVPTEVATLSGTLTDGQTIPLPVYADGTTALESECKCKWTVSLHYVHQVTSGAFSTEACRTEGRMVRCYGIVNEDTAYPWPASGQRFLGDANYLIIATRGVSAPTGARSTSIGALKAKYR